MGRWSLCDIWTACRGCRLRSVRHGCRGLFGQNHTPRSLALSHSDHTRWSLLNRPLSLGQKMRGYLTGFWPFTSVVEHASFQLIESGFACLRRRTRRLTPTCRSSPREHPAASRTIPNPAVHDKSLVLCAILLYRLHMLLQRLFIGLFLTLGILFQLTVNFTPVLRVTRFMWLLLPVWYVSFYEAEPDFARLSE